MCPMLFKTITGLNLSILYIYQICPKNVGNRTDRETTVVVEVIDITPTDFFQIGGLNKNDMVKCIITCPNFLYLGNNCSNTTLSLFF